MGLNPSAMQAYVNKEGQSVSNADEANFHWGTLHPSEHFVLEAQKTYSIQLLSRDPRPMYKVRRRGGVQLTSTTSEACWDLFPRDWAASVLPCGYRCLQKALGWF